MDGGKDSNREALTDAWRSEDASACSKHCAWTMFFLVPALPQLHHLALPPLCFCGVRLGLVKGLFWERLGIVLGGSLGFVLGCSGVVLFGTVWEIV